MIRLASPFKTDKGWRCGSGQDGSTRWRPPWSALRFEVPQGSHTPAGQLMEHPPNPMPIRTPTVFPGSLVHNGIVENAYRGRPRTRWKQCGWREQRRRYYRLTDPGRSVLQREAETLEKVVSFARAKHVV